MGPDQVIIELGDAAARLHVAVGRSRTAVERTRIPLRPVALSPEGAVLTGREALDRGQEAPESALTDLLERIGDPAPCRVGDLSRTPEELLAAVLERPLSTFDAPEQDVAELLVLVPAHWGAHRRALVEEELGGRVPVPVRVVAAPVAALHGARPALGAGIVRAVVVDAGTDRIAITTLIRSDAGPEGAWRIEGTAVARTGLEDFDDALLGFVLARLPAPLAPQHRGALRAECRSARAALRTAPATQLSLPGGAGTIRLVRGDLEELAGQTLRGELRRAIGRLDGVVADGSSDTGSWTDESIPVLVIGEFAGQSLLVETVSSLLGRPVRVAEDPEYAAVDAAARWAAAEGASVQAADGPDAPSWLEDVVRPKHRRRDRGRARGREVEPGRGPGAGRLSAFPRASSAATAPLATAPLATAPLTTAPLATAPLTTAPLATAPLRPAPLHTAALRLVPAASTDEPAGRGRPLLLTVLIVLLLATAITWLVVDDPLAPLLDVLADRAAEVAQVVGEGMT